LRLVAAHVLVFARENSPAYGFYCSLQWPQLILQANFGARAVLTMSASPADCEANCRRRFNCKIEIGQGLTDRCA
jgi:hypothetical protein